MSAWVWEADDKNVAARSKTPILVTRRHRAGFPQNLEPNRSEIKHLIASRFQGCWREDTSPDSKAHGEGPHKKDEGRSPPVWHQTAATPTLNSEFAHGQPSRFRARPRRPRPNGTQPRNWI